MGQASAYFSKNHSSLVPWEVSHGLTEEDSEEVYDLYYLYLQPVVTYTIRKRIALFFGLLIGAVAYAMAARSWPQTVVGGLDFLSTSEAVQYLLTCLTLMLATLVGGLCGSLTVWWHAGMWVKAIRQELVRTAKRSPTIARLLKHIHETETRPEYIEEIARLLLRNE